MRSPDGLSSRALHQSRMRKIQRLVRNLPRAAGSSGLLASLRQRNDGSFTDA
jgi:hypothetical protein